MGETLSHEDFLNQRRFPALDGLRAVSILLVFTAHPAYRKFWPALHGAAGVTIFFVLSGFLITTLLLREHAKHNRVDLKAFYIRRLFRIYPLYVLILLTYCVLILLLGLQPERRASFASNVPYFLAFFPEHSMFFNHFDVEVPFNMSWSIGIEEKFYLIWPLLGFAVLAAFKRLRLAAIIGLTVALSLAGYLAGPWAPALAPYANISCGALMAILLHHRRSYDVLRQLGRPWVLATLSIVWLVAQFGTDKILESGSLYTPYGALVALIVAALLTTSTRRIRWLSSRTMVYIGALSYCLYLIHNFGLNAAEMVVPAEWGLPGSLLSTVLGLALAFMAAHLVHRYFEDPLRLYGARLAKERRSVGAVPRVTEVEAERS